MRADRLLSILLLLQVHRRMTAHELALRLEVSERTIHRDMEALSATGVPVTADRGNGGGWRLLGNYRTNLTGLNEAEIQTLFLSIPDNILTDLGLHQASEAALIKMLAALPSQSQRDAEYVRQRIYVDVTGWNRAEEAVPALPLLQEAIWQERRLLIKYERGESFVERLIDPLGLVAKGSIWYLVAAVEGQVRSYRVSRMHDVRDTDQSSSRPAHFDLAQYWNQASADFKAGLPHYMATVRVDRSILSYMRLVGRYAHIEQVDTANEDGWIQLAIQFQDERGACEYVVSFGAQIEVIEPASLKEKVVQTAMDILNLYEQKSFDH